LFALGLEGQPCCRLWAPLNLADAQATNGIITVFSICGLYFVFPFFDQAIG
jgi:hypothetical protein